MTTEEDKELVRVSPWGWDSSHKSIQLHIVAEMPWFDLSTSASDKAMMMMPQNSTPIAAKTVEWLLY